MDRPELQLQSFDVIRFASYRTACKLRFLQKYTNLHLIDIWNVIEAFRENGLNTLDPQNEISVSKLETLISSLYHNLNKRLPIAQHVPVESKASVLLNWLLSAYCGADCGKIRVFSIKVALAIMCAGKIVDKLRYIFSQISDGAGQLIHWKSASFVKDLLALPAAVFESPSFHYRDGLETELFPLNNRITVNDFIATLIIEPGPPCLVWLLLLQKLASVEAVVHNTICSACNKENFTGFRYRCQRCKDYSMCQDCFWVGRVSGEHKNDHEVKEYSNFKSPSKKKLNSIRKSFRCYPENPNQALPRFPEHPEKTLNLSHIVPPSPLPAHNGFMGQNGMMGMDCISSLDGKSLGISMDSTMSRNCLSSDEEHKLIARYAAKLAQEDSASTAQQCQQDSPILGMDGARRQREIIAELENKNKEIMKEIQRLRRQEETDIEGGGQFDGGLMNELRALRQRKGELEGHLGALQDSRRHLMSQLEGLMRMLKSHQVSSPRSSPNSSPRSARSPPINQQIQQHGEFE
uniref:CSON007154 protein n=1 Tax=Culicoides sonorensis TaxID=179676 RepID=A0A336MUA2_CULSO